MAKPRKTKTTKTAAKLAPEQWPTYRPSDTDTLIAAKMAERAAANLKVTMPDTGWVGYFASTASRDEFVARATAKGRRVVVG